MKEIEVIDQDSSHSMPNQGERHWKQAIFTRLHEAVKNCLYVANDRNGSVLSDEDDCVDNLCSQIQACLAHGLLRSSSLSKQLTTILAATLTLSHIEESNSDLFSLFESTQPKSLIIQFKNDFNELSNYEKSRTFIKKQLNDGMIEQFFKNLLACDIKLRDHYHPWAFLLDREWSSTLAQIAQGISKIHFSLNISGSKSYGPPPVISVSQGIASKKKPIWKPHRTVINRVVFDSGRISSDDNSSTVRPAFGEATGRMKSIKRQINVRRESSKESNAETPPVSTLQASDSLQRDIEEWQFKQLVRQSTEEVSEAAIDSGSESCNSSYRTPSSSLPHIITAEEEIPTLKLRESGASPSSGSECHSTSLYLKQVDSDEVVELKRKLFDAENQIEQLKQQVEFDQSRLNELQNCDLSQTTGDNSEFYTGDNSTLAVYEQKLVQMAMMHADLLELNNQLVHNLNRRTKQLKRANELLANYCPRLSLEELQIEQYGKVNESQTLPKSGQFKAVISVPSAFLAGKRTDVHHVYQINVRIKGVSDQSYIDDFNVYRRYSHILRWHKTMCKSDKYFAEKIQAPKKKFLGKKEKSFVNERRRQLECYFNDAIDYIISTYPEFSIVPLDRRSIQQNIEILCSTESEN